MFQTDTYCVCINIFIRIYEYKNVDNPLLYIYERLSAKSETLSV